MTQSNLRAQYRQLKTLRDPYLNRARQASELTLPYLINRSDEGATPSEELIQPTQSMGARGVNSVVSKLVLTLFPVNTLFFRLLADPETFEQQDQQQQNDIETAMSENEQQLVREFETRGYRPKMHEVMQHLVVAGNVGLDLRKRIPRVFPLDSYVVRRDGSGEVTLLIIRQLMDPRYLPDEFLDMEISEEHHEPSNARQDQKFVGIYTGLELQKNPKESDTFGKYRLWTELGDGVHGPVDESFVDAERVPLLALRFNAKDGEDYGRGLVELNFGDLRSLEALNQIIIEGSAASAKVLFLVDPNGLTDPADLEAPNGRAVSGRERDVSAVQVNKQADLSVALTLMQRIESRLGFAFGLNSTSIRNAERVTTEEVRLIARELDEQQGGVFSQLSSDLQLPLVRQLLIQAEKDGNLTAPGIEIAAAIVTGSAGIGRNHELARMEQWMELGATKFGEAWLRTIVLEEYQRITGAALGVDVERLVKSQEAIQQEEQQQQVMALAQSGVGSEATKQLLGSEGAQAAINGALGG